jgi:hypothetical protein
MRFPFSAPELDRLVSRVPEAVAASSVLARRSISGDEQPVRQLGGMLLDALLAGSTYGMFAASRSQADCDGRHLRLVLQIRPPELDRLPWEFLFDSREDDYVCLSTPLIRYPQVFASVRPMQVTAPLRILCMTAEPRDQARLATAAEEERLRATLRGLEQTGLVELGWAGGQTWRDLRAAMRLGPWHVFHFIGHGGFDAVAQQGMLALTGENGRTYHLGADNLAMLLRGHPSLRLVVLNACDTGRANAADPFSSVAGALIRRGIPAVLAMQYQISDKAALEFGRTFYEGLAERCPVDLSVTQARQAIRLASPSSLEWGTPVLYMRSPNGDLFDFTTASTGIQSQHYRMPGPDPVPPDGDVELPELHISALSALYAERWDEAIDSFHALLSDGGIHADAERRLAEAQRGKRLAALYTAACGAIADKRWPEAISQLTAVVAAEHGYRDAVTLLHQATKEQEATPLRAELAALHRAGQWHAVIAVGERLKALVPDTADPAGLIGSALAELDAAEHQTASGGGERETGLITAAGLRATRVATIRAPASVHAVAFSPDSDRLALGCGKHQMVVVDQAGDQLLRLRHGSGEQAIRDVSYDPVRGWLAIAGDDCTVRVWDTTAAKPRRICKVVHDRAVLGLAFSPDGASLATGSADGTARIWDAATGSGQLRVSHESKVPDVAFSPDGCLLATASWDNTARIWAVGSGERRLEVAHRKAVMGVAFSPDGRWLATAGWDGAARVWDASSAADRLTVYPGEHVWTVAFSPDGRALATGSSDGFARIWAVETGDLLFEAPHTEAVSSVVFGPDGRLFAAGSLDKTVQLWRLTKDDDG